MEPTINLDASHIDEVEEKKDSIQISMSELEGIANSRKLNQDVERERSVVASPPPLQRQDSVSVKRSEAKDENADSYTRNKKLDMLYKISQINSTYKKSSNVTLDNSLYDIEMELNRLTHEVRTVKGVDVCKTMLMLSVQGLEMANTRFDPIGVDLHGWSESMAYSMQNNDYDEVLTELYEKYGGDVKVMPEIKLLLMITGSAAMFAWTKRMTKTVDPMEAFGKFFNKEKTTAPPTSNFDAQDSFVSSSRLDEPEESINLNTVLEQMNTPKKKGGRPPGSKNKKKTVVIG